MTQRSPDEQGTHELADLPVEGLPPDAPERGSAAVDTAPPDPDPRRAAHDPDADRGARTMMEAYVTALADGNVDAATDLYAEQAAVRTEDEQYQGREGVRRWHEHLLAEGPGRVTAEPAGQGNDKRRRGGDARWLRPETFDLEQEERARRAL